VHARLLNLAELADGAAELALKRALEVQALREVGEPELVLSKISNPTLPPAGTPALASFSRHS